MIVQPGSTDGVRQADGARPDSQAASRSAWAITARPACPGSTRLAIR